MNDKAKALQAILDQVLANKSLEPEKNEVGEVVKTYCNFGIQMTAALLDYWAFKPDPKKDGLLANAIVAYMASESIKQKAWKDWKEKKEGKEPAMGEWVEVAWKDAYDSACLGIWTIAGCYGKPHGHVASVYPFGLSYSTKWKKECPVVANIGQRNGRMGANWAFASEPRYFAFVRHLLEIKGEA